MDKKQTSFFGLFARRTFVHTSREISLRLDQHHPQLIQIVTTDRKEEYKQLILCTERDNLVKSIRKANPNVAVSFHLRSTTKIDFQETFKCQCINLFGIEASNEILQRVLNSASEFTSLDLSRSFHNQKYLEAISECIRWNFSLTHLNLSACQIRKEGLKILCAVLGKSDNSTLSSLNLSLNSLDEEAGGIMGQFLAGNNSIRELILDGNNLAHGAAAVGVTLSVNTCLITLSLAQNGIDGDTALVFAKTLAVNSTLKSLDFSRNSIDEEAAQPLINTLSVNATLTRFAIGENPKLLPETLKALTRFPRPTPAPALYIPAASPVQSAVSLSAAASPAPSSSASAASPAPSSSAPSTPLAASLNDEPQGDGKLWLTRSEFLKRSGREERRVHIACVHCGKSQEFAEDVVGKLNTRVEEALLTTASMDVLKLLQTELIKTGKHYLHFTHTCA